MRGISWIIAAVALVGCADPLRPAGPRRWTGDPDAGAPIEIDASVPIVTAETPPPPISGGTLALSEDGTVAVAADPDLDAIFVVGVEDGTVRAIELARGDEPGRVVLDGSGRAHVALRRGGAIADVDLATGTLIERRAVCSAPRGIAWRALDDTLHVACADGALVTLPAGGGAPVRALALGDDLRDVVARGEVLWVSRFKSAHVLRVALDGTVIDERALPEVEVAGAIMRAGVAWRMIDGEGGVVVLHQRMTTATFAPVGYYGGGCGGGILHQAITTLADDGTITSSAPIDDLVLGVDVARWAGRLAIATPAGAYRREDSSTILLLSGETSPDVLSVDAATATTEPGCVSREVFPRGERDGAAIAVAARPDRPLVIQTRAPAQLVIGSRVIRLDARDAFDTGHMLFHARTLGGIACASCHPEAGDDGHTWTFADLGPRRTQTMRGGLLSTAPFHWAGDIADFDHLVEEVFVHRMGGSIRDPREVDAFAAWMDTLPPLPAPAIDDPDAALRGRALFEDPVVACAGCHAGAHLTNGATVDVGTGEPLQVPTLLGVAHHAPFMHDGCAPTLRDRFTDAACGGGDLHGRTSHLDAAQIDDLVAYLRTL